MQQVIRGLRKIQHRNVIVVDRLDKNVGKKWLISVDRILYDFDYWNLGVYKMIHMGAWSGLYKIRKETQRLEVDAPN